MQNIKAKFLNLKTSIYSKFIRLQNPEIKTCKTIKYIVEKRFQKWASFLFSVTIYLNCMKGFILWMARV
jgi:hypothetical protein